LHYLSFSTHCSTQKSDETADRTKVNQMLLTVLLLASAIHGAIADVADVANVADVEVRTTRFHNGSSLTHFVICLSSCHQSYKWKEDLTDLLFSGRTIRVIIIQMPYWIPLIVQTLGKTTGIIGILTRSKWQDSADRRRWMASSSCYIFVAQGCLAERDVAART